MACNPLFNQSLALESGTNEDTIRQIHELSTRFEFGRSLALREPKLATESATYTFAPPLTAEEQRGASVFYSFEQLPRRQAVPYVTAAMENHRR